MRLLTVPVAALTGLLTFWSCNTGPSEAEQKLAQENAYLRGLVDGQGKTNPDTIYVQADEDQITLGNTSPSTVGQVNAPTVGKVLKLEAFAPSQKLKSFIQQSRSNGEMYHFYSGVREFIKKSGWTDKRYLDSLRTPQWQSKQKIVQDSYSDLNLGAVHVPEWLGEAKKHFERTGQIAVITEDHVKKAYGPDTYAANYVFRALTEKVQKGGNRVVYNKPAVYFTTEE